MIVQAHTAGVWSSAARTAGRLGAAVEATLVAVAAVAATASAAVGAGCDPT